VCTEYNSRFADRTSKDDEAVYICNNTYINVIDCRVFEAARATMAALTYFPPIDIKGRRLADVGMGFNNPSFELYGHYKHPDCSDNGHQDGPLADRVRFANIGTGTRSNWFRDRRRHKFNNIIPLIPSFVHGLRSLKKVSVRSGRAATDMRIMAAASGRGVEYFRLSAATGVC
jgi:hypothetical protein